MPSKTISLGAPFGWLADALALCRSRVRLLIGAAALVMAALLLPSLVELLMIAALHPSETVVLGIQLVGVLFSVLAFPPLFGGYFRMVDATVGGRPASPLDVFAVYRDAESAWRLILTSLAFLVIAIIVFGGLAVAAGASYLIELFKVIMTATPGQAPTLPPVPPGFRSWILVFVLVGVVFATAQGLSQVQAALCKRNPVQIVGDAFAATVRNLGAFLLFYLAMLLVTIVVVVVFVLVIALLAFVLASLSTTVALVVLLPIYLALIVTMYALTFTFTYYAWRGLLGGADAAPSDQLAV